MPAAPQKQVCLDGRSLALREGTGVASYAHALADFLPAAGWSVATLRATAASRPERWLRALVPGGAVARRDGGGFVARDVFRVAQVRFDIHRRPLVVRSAAPPALMHWTYPLPMVFKGAPNVTTVHDLIPLRHPALTDIDSARFGRLLAHVAATADHVVTVSEASRRDILAETGLDPSRVTCTYEPVRLPLGLAAAPPPGRRGHFLFCGTVEPRKNVGRLIAAHRASGTAAPLILAGPDGWRAAAECAAGGVEIRALDADPAPGGVYRAPWLERAALLDLLRGARALLFPSLAEGFGLPVAEAMALGVPVLTSAGGATGEIAGEAALLVDPLDVRSIAGGIAALAADDGLCARLAAAGRRRAALFAPETCMARLAAVYERVLSAT